jgi:hypothetical protein
MSPALKAGKRKGRGCLKHEALSIQRTTTVVDIAPLSTEMLRWSTALIEDALSSTAMYTYSNVPSGRYRDPSSTAPQRYTQRSAKQILGTTWIVISGMEDLVSNCNGVRFDSSTSLMLFFRDHR